MAHFPSGLTVLACLALAVSAVWYASPPPRGDAGCGTGAAALLLAGALALVVLEGHVVEDRARRGVLVAALATARQAFRVHVELPPAPRPAHPVLFYNPLSGGGKAERFHLADEARRRGIEPIELRRGEDLAQLVRAAVERGADAWPWPAETDRRRSWR